MTMSTAGSVLFLIDESAAMASDFPDDAPTGPTSAPSGPPPVPGKSTAPVAANPNSKAVRLATAVNAWIKRTAGHSAADIAIVGYATDTDGAAAVKSRWGAGLAGKSWVPLSVAATEPVRVEQRTRKLPALAPGNTLPQSIDFPVWLEPRTVGKAAQLAGWNRCVELLNEWCSLGATVRRPVIVHLFASTSGDGNPQRVIDQLRQHPSNPIILQIHLRSSRSVMPTLYPSNIYFLPAGAQKDLFKRCSPLPDEWKSALQARKQSVQPQAVGMLFNARLADVAQALSLVETHVDGASSGTQPAAAPTVDEAAVSTAVPMPLTPTVATPPSADAIVVLTDIVTDQDSPTETPTDDAPSNSTAWDAAPTDAAVENNLSAFAPVERTGPRAAVFLLDRSLADPYSSALNSPFSKLQERMNRALGLLSRKPTGQLHIAMVTYAGDESGGTDVRTETWSADQAGREWVTDTDLATAAIRIEETVEERSNGIGGLISIPIKKPIYVEAESAGQGSLIVAAQHVGRLVDGWSQQHGDVVREAVVIHFSRAGWTSEDVRSAASEFAALRIPAVQLHVLLPDAPHPAVTYPASGDGLSLPEVQAAFEASGPLPGAATGDVSRPGIVVPESRGMTVNAEFDVLAESLRVGLTV